MVAHVCDPSTQGLEAGESVVHGHPLCDLRPHPINIDRQAHIQTEGEETKNS